MNFVLLIYSLCFVYQESFVYTRHNTWPWHMSFLGYAFCLGGGMENLNSFLPLAMLPVMKLFCQKRSWKWNTAESTSKKERTPGTCWAPQCRWHRQPSPRSLWTPARYPDLSNASICTVVILTCSGCHTLDCNPLECVFTVIQFICMMETSFIMYCLPLPCPLTYFLVCCICFLKGGPKPLHWFHNAVMGHSFR